MVNQSGNSARTAILESIRRHLAKSVLPNKGDHTSAVNLGAEAETAKESIVFESPVELFCRQLRSVGGHCVVVKGEAEAGDALHRILAGIQSGVQRPLKIALSDAPLLSRLAGAVIGEATTSPGAGDLFDFDVGITTAQAAIAESGTLVLESDQERHRLVSLLPPVHIVLVDASDLCGTLAEALELVRRAGAEMSRAITFITGPSRTADIELTLTIGVHGPKELYVIVNEGEPINRAAI